MQTWHGEQSCRSNRGLGAWLGPLSAHTPPNLHLLACQAQPGPQEAFLALTAGLPAVPSGVPLVLVCLPP